MKAPSFWWQDRPGWPARLLSPLGSLYGAITAGRMRKPGARIGRPVICIGNFIAGGAGKTPTAIAITRLLAQRGETPFVLMRGYGGRLPGPVEVDPAAHAAADVGDEPLLMSRHARTVIARDRLAGGVLAARAGASVLVMDDGLQNPALAKDLVLAVVDGASGIGNGLCLPAGPLRAPLALQLPAVDALVLIGGGAAGEQVAQAAKATGKPILRGALRPDEAVANHLRGRPVLALSGIGRPEKFRATLEAMSAQVRAEARFGDHHAYRASDVADVIAQARRLGTLVATTEKDMTKLQPLWPMQDADLLVPVPVTLEFEEPGLVATLLERVLAAR
ncbi:tetraacyldisaccharide 4'-kinase [Bosea sp. (in: a-proteobacteria)]|uniref:tetraacyldisaccharide 4'-kinase n=1 Tax=Bosea sp. (in: a-proteobacteria) TaxID=1871050 RepID=UPI003B3A7778